jgi:hypothetical protein
MLMLVLYPVQSLLEKKVMLWPVAVLRRASMIKRRFLEGLIMLVGACKTLQSQILFQGWCSQSG